MDPLHERLAGAAREALALFVPVSCVGCGNPDVAVCAVCAAGMRGPVTRRDLVPGFPVWAGTEYTGVARRVILALKNDQRTDTAGALAPVLGRAVESAVVDLSAESTARGVVTLAALPSTRAAYRRRGYRPTDVVGRQTGMRIEHPLAWLRQPVDQIGLGIDARQANLAGSLRASRRVAGRRFLVVDDVVTTGGTLREARRALLAGGGIVLGAAVIAATPLQIPRASPPAHFAE